jgi:LPS-assembly protein
LLPSTRLQALPRQPGTVLPIVLRANSLSSQLDQGMLAEGAVEFRRGGVVIRADQLAYDVPSDTATATGQVRVSRDGLVLTGPEMRLSVQRFEGYFLQPQFEFLQLGAGGSAERLDFLGASRTRATQARYTSCARDDGGEPAWELRTERVTFDLNANEGLAEGAKLRFLGTTILALPTLSFPINDARKSGWLPPSVSIDNRSGVELAVPYYWNIAPNRDATLAPRFITRRGLGLDAEFRYLEPGLQGSLALDWLPYDRVAGEGRKQLQWQHSGQLPAGLTYSAAVLRVSDNDWWKDFPKANRSFTARLLPSTLQIERQFDLASSAPTEPGALAGQGLLYARLAQWQVLQATDSFITAPYQRSPQVGLQINAQHSGLQLALQTEFNRFTLPGNQATATQRNAGDRLHVLGAVSLPWRQPGWWVVPKLAVNAARYSGTNGAGPLVSSQGPADPVRGARVIPTFSIDAGLELERTAVLFGRQLQQTLEPRLLYVNTPYRAQSQLPNYDSAAKDFNFVSIYSDNAFSGVDRVSDSHQLTTGFTTRLVDTATGAEALRVGLVQRYLFRPQRISPQADGTPDGEPLTQRFSDALLVGSTSVLPGWTLDAAVQYSPDINRSVRSILGARYSPGPYRTVGATYRLARGLSEQLEVGWQWPVWGTGPGSVSPEHTPLTAGSMLGAKAAGMATSNSGSCTGTWYSVGRFNYSLKDRRVTDAVLGAEYDAGCWIGRIVAERLSTGRSEGTTRFLFQLELVGLSRLGSNPLRVLKDNIPGYRLLRDERGSTSSPSADRPTVSPFYE